MAATISGSAGDRDVLLRYEKLHTSGRGIRCNSGIMRVEVRTAIRAKSDAALV